MHQRMLPGKGQGNFPDFLGENFEKKIVLNRKENSIIYSKSLMKLV